MQRISDPFIDRVNIVKHELKLQSRKSFQTHKVQCPLCIGLTKSFITIRQVKNHVKTDTHLAQLREYRSHFEEY